MIKKIISSYIQDEDSLILSPKTAPNNKNILQITNEHMLPKSYL